MSISSFFQNKPFLTILTTACLVASCSVKEETIATNCVRHMLEMEIMPFKGQSGMDQSYDYFAINSSNQDIKKCLIANVANETKMDDPRQTPLSYNFRVGDLSLFLLNDFYDLNLTEIYPSEVLRKHSIIGVAAYFEYVRDSEGGRKIIKKNVENYYIK